MAEIRINQRREMRIFFQDERRNPGFGKTRTQMNYLLNQDVISEKANYQIG